ncbi:hypothetical protein Taro_001546 [Colocasia esculenta]|uniref:Uncharacterized protein n=1 Tax=Colocasia esculenta TaxID=4460 RepID=A0A843TG84_COLES|nr:hypothetical protein [Colocasia esculenta]
MGPRNRENTEAGTTRNTGLPKARPTTPTETRHSRAVTTMQARATRNTWKRREENIVITTTTKPLPLAAKRETRNLHALLASLAPASASAQGRDRAATETHNTRNAAAWPSCGLTPDTTTWLRNRCRERHTPNPLASQTYTRELYKRLSAAVQTSFSPQLQSPLTWAANSSSLIARSTPSTGSRGRGSQETETTSERDKPSSAKHRANRAVLGEPHQNVAQPNGTLRTTMAQNEHRPSERTLQQAELQKQHKPILGEPPPEPPGTVPGKTTRTDQPNQQRTSDSEVAQQQQKRARNSPERNPHQDNNKAFWESSTRAQGNQAMHLNLEGNATATRNGTTPRGSTTRTTPNRWLVAHDKPSKR